MTAKCLFTFLHHMWNHKIAFYRWKKTHVNNVIVDSRVKISEVLGQ